VVALMSGAAFAAGDAAAGKAKYGSICASCHGMNGEGAGIFPKLAGKTDAAAKLKDYKAGKQVGPNTAMMAPQAAGLSDADIENLAAHIATLK
ncbi:MAG: c-type cytochrome, partial [Pseudomonadota bacterium]